MSSRNSRHGFQLRSINNIIKSLFQPRETVVNIHKQGGSAHKRYPGEYYKTIYLNEKMFAGVRCVAKIEKISKKQATHLLLEAGFGYWMGEKIKEDIKNRLGLT